MTRTDSPVTVTFDPTVILPADAREDASVQVLLATGRFTAENARATARGLQTRHGKGYGKALDNLVARGLISTSSWKAARGYTN